jgi:hypothetical protein
MPELDLIPMPPWQASQSVDENVRLLREWVDRNNTRIMEWARRLVTAIDAGGP